MIMLRMMTGVAAGVVRWLVPAPVAAVERGTSGDDRRAAEALAAMRDANAAAEAGTAEAEREAALGGCYHDEVAYSLGYDANGVVELSGETFTNLDTGMDGGAMAALRKHRQDFDPNRDIPRFIVALKPVRIIKGKKDDETYGLPPGPRGGDRGRLVADGEPCGHPGCLSHVSHPCEGCGRVAGGLKVCDDCGEIEVKESCCYRCETWVCNGCFIDDMCGNCFGKVQGGVI